MGKMGDGFEWLTKAICDEYIKKAAKLPPNGGLDIGPWRALRIELQERCKITEIEAYNILRGYHINTYLQKYAILSGAVPMPPAMLEAKKKKRKQPTVP